ncbi:putative RecB family exonuclease [Williamsia sterculiae]|uniref:Putative RecB family exonuclease n=1 Tax=Williamsia sterculiae TaxID=1344003 RepID=A0A1N7EMB4_9NOCA|nr:putative RecB family exonuclease [Williamsia sterculiae]
MGPRYPASVSSRIVTRPTLLDVVEEVTAPSGSTTHRQAAARHRPALSPSRAADFKQCPLLYRLRAIDRIPETPTTAQARGTLVHAALENLFDLPAELRTPEAALDLVDGAWAAICAQAPELRELVPEDETTTFLSGAHKLMTTYFRMEDPSRFDAESCEVRVEVEIDGDVLLRGFVDRVDVAPDGRVRVVDYKTGRSPGEAFEAKALFQMKFYALAIQRTTGTLPTRLQLMYLADGQQLTYDPDRDEIERFGRTLAAIWRAIRTAGTTGDFRPRRSRMCSFCDHRSLCPEFGGTPPPYPGWPEP